MNAISVLRLGAVDRASVASLLDRCGLRLEIVAPGAPIPGSFWGEPEAGLSQRRLFARGDTPVHSVLHEACHYACMTEARRARLERDAGGDPAEENAVCYLQVLFSDAVPGMGRARMLLDMDRWGYGFRLGSARLWFESDAEDARAWLVARGLIDDRDTPRFLVRSSSGARTP